MAREVPHSEQLQERLNESAGCWANGMRKANVLVYSNSVDLRDIKDRIALPQVTYSVR